MGEGGGSEGVVSLGWATAAASAASLNATSAVSEVDARSGVRAVRRSSTWIFGGKRGGGGLGGLSVGIELESRSGNGNEYM